MGQERGLRLYTEQEGKSVFIYADNDQLYPQSTSITLDLTGLKPRNEPPDWHVVPAQSQKQQLIELVIPQGRSWGYEYNFVYFRGDINAQHNDDYTYRLPFKTGKTFRVVQGYNGPQSHMGENALDFDLPTGEPVHAAREGLVVLTKEDSNQGCPNKGCATLGNYVTILHEDGTFADYYHLRQNGALVKPGDVVERGQPIGESGNTGWATGPHLHFIVYRRTEDKRITIETRFKTSQSERIFLEAKRSYKAVQ